MTPRTAAGRALLDIMDDWERRTRTQSGHQAWADARHEVMQRLGAIEAEARAAALDEAYQQVMSRKLGPTAKMGITEWADGFDQGWNACREAIDALRERS